MMYQGSKRRIVKDILPIILKNRKPDQWFVEPFVGGANVLQHVTGNRLGSDVNPYVIALLKEITTNPDIEEALKSLPKISEEKYYQIRSNPEDFEPWYVGFALCGLGFGGIYGAIFAKYKDTDFQERFINTLIKYYSPLIGTTFVCRNYLDLDIPKESIVYCDPPYFGVTKYWKNFKSPKFDRNEFWAWCDQLVKEGHQVFVSERIAPERWTRVFSKELVYTPSFCP